MILSDLLEIFKVKSHVYQPLILEQCNLRAVELYKCFENREWNTMQKICADMTCQESIYL